MHNCILHLNFTTRHYYTNSNYKSTKELYLLINKGTYNRFNLLILNNAAISIYNQIGINLLIITISMYIHYSNRLN